MLLSSKCAFSHFNLKIDEEYNTVVISGWNGLSDSQKIADKRKIKIVDFAAVEIHADPADLDATVQLIKIRESGMVAITHHHLKVNFHTTH